MLKRSKRKAGRVVKRRLADGTVKEYHYAPYRPKRRRVPGDSMAALVAAYRRSPEWDGLAQHTRSTYAIYLRPLEEVGHLSVRAFTRRMLLIIRDGIAKGRGNGAGTGFTRASSALFGWAVDHDWIEHTPVPDQEAARRPPSGLDARRS